MLNAIRNFPISYNYVTERYGDCCYKVRLGFLGGGGGGEVDLLRTLFLGYYDTCILKDYND